MNYKYNQKGYWSLRSPCVVCAVGAWNTEEALREVQQDSERAFFLGQILWHLAVREGWRNEHDSVLPE